MKTTRTHAKPDSTPSHGVKKSIHEIADIPNAKWRRSSRMFRGVLGCAVLPYNNSTTTGDIHNLHPKLQEPQQRHSNLLGYLRETPDITTELADHEPNPSNEQNCLRPPTISKQPSDLQTHLSVFGYSLAPLYDFWERLQVSHCGQYSVERMLALDEYCQRVSILRVLSVCFLFPFGPLLIIIFTEFLPLQSVEKGALANYVFWIRHTLMGIILIVCGMAQAKVWIPEMKLSMTQIVIVAIGSAVVYTFLNILIANLWGFPIPFLIVAGAPVLFSIWAIASRLALGPNPMESIHNGVFRGRRFLLLTSVHAALLGIYPAYQALFLAVDGALQFVVVALMPVLKLALKNLQTVWGSHLQDSLPEVIVFTCDVFGTIYSVLCMHSANSMRMVVVIVSLDAFAVMMSLYGMNRRSRMARAYRLFRSAPFQQQLVEKTPLELKAFDTSESLGSLVISAVRLLQVPGQLDTMELSKIRLLSGMQHKLSEENTALLTSLGSRSVYNNERRTSKIVTVRQMKSQYATAVTEGRKLSSSHFVVPSPPRSKMFQRLQAALIVVPMVNSHFKTKPRVWFGSLPSFRRDTDYNGSNPDKFRRLSLRPLKSLNNLPSSRLPSGLLAIGSSLIRMRKASSTGSVQPAITSNDLYASAKLFPVVRTSNPVIGSVLEETRIQNTRVVKQTLHLLFNNEYLGLIAYTQCFIPVIYLIYMPFLQVMPNHEFYPTHYRYFGDTHEFSERMSVIASLAAMQFTALIILQMFVSKRFGVSTIYQVAFVLETQFLFLQGRLLIWLIFAVQSTLEHYGADFTFQFAWVRH